MTSMSGDQKLVDLIQLVQAGSDAWNEWRQNNPTTLADLRGAPLRGCQLQSARLHDVNFAGADLSSSNLRGADLRRSDLRGALLTDSDLRKADFRSAVLADVTGGIGNSVIDITNADFTEAVFGWTLIGDIYLNRMIGIGQIRHAGPSYLSTSTLEFTVDEISRSGTFRTDIEVFLRGAGVALEAFEQFERGLRSHAFCSAFISYSHTDRNFATWLLEELQRRGIRCWLDDKNMLPGDNILDKMAEAIGSHDKILVCCSKASLESWWVKDEIHKVLEIERHVPRTHRIIPLLLDDYLLDTWEDGLAANLRSRRAADFRQVSGRQEQLESLIDALKKSDAVSSPG